MHGSSTYKSVEGSKIITTSDLNPRRPRNLRWLQTAAVDYNPAFGVSSKIHRRRKGIQNISDDAAYHKRMMPILTRHISISTCISVVVRGCAYNCACIYNGRG